MSPRRLHVLPLLALGALLSLEGADARAARRGTSEREHLSTALETGSDLERRAALRRLSALGDADARRRLVAALRRLRALGADRARLGLLRILAGTACHDEVRTALLEELQSRELDERSNLLRETAALGLARCGDPASQEALALALHWPSPGSEAALVAHRARPLPDALLLRDADVPTAAWYEALALSSSAGTQAPLRRALEQPEAPLSTSALLAAARAQHPLALPTAQRWLTDGSTVEGLLGAVVVTVTLGDGAVSPSAAKHLRALPPRATLPWGAAPRPERLEWLLEALRAASSAEDSLALLTLMTPTPGEPLRHLLEDRRLGALAARALARRGDEAARRALDSSDAPAAWLARTLLDFEAGQLIASPSPAPRGIGESLLDWRASLLAADVNSPAASPSSEPRRATAEASLIETCRALLHSRRASLGDLDLLSASTPQSPCRGLALTELGRRYPTTLQLDWHDWLTSRDELLAASLLRGLVEAPVPPVGLAPAAYDAALTATRRRAALALWRLAHGTLATEAPPAPFAPEATAPAATEAESPVPWCWPVSVPGEKSEATARLVPPSFGQSCPP